jgi:hypothetical protein
MKTFQNLYDELNKRESLRDRFIVFPHVGEGGNSTMLRSGFASQFKNMPCVGGFVDGSVTQHGKGNVAIFNGNNKETETRPLLCSRHPTTGVETFRNWERTSPGLSGRAPQLKHFARLVLHVNPPRLILARPQRIEEIRPPYR